MRSGDGLGGPGRGSGRRGAAAGRLWRGNNSSTTGVGTPRPVITVKAPHRRGIRDLSPLRWPRCCRRRQQEPRPAVASPRPAARRPPPTASHSPEKVGSAEEFSLAAEALVGEGTAAVGAADTLGVPRPLQHRHQELARDGLLAAVTTHYHLAWSLHGRAARCVDHSSRRQCQTVAHTDIECHGAAQRSTQLLPGGQ